MHDQKTLEDASALDYAISTDGGKIIIRLIDEMVSDARDGVWALSAQEIGTEKDILLRAQGTVAEALKDKIFYLIEQGKQLRATVDH